ncbi:TolC family protein [Sphingobacterium spiritivorum]|uniref:TolC family protein n=1 Tax=Sphingobacterium spiritivorum TaxID=258 RepID=UPI00191B4C3B|nr:TolC family protein [Sphingobacterium spiritivorum]QQT25954.1 TolC family protein [Sphingobacterium spiritivorum]
MAKKLTNYLLLGACLSLATFCQAQSNITVQEAIKLTLERNLQIKEAEYRRQLTEQDVSQAKGNLYPNLSLSGSQSNNYGFGFDQVSGNVVRGQWNHNANAQISSSYAVFQGFQLVNQVKANKLQLLSDATAVEKAKNDLILSVLTNYLQAITNNELYEASKQQLKLSKEQLRTDSIQFEVGNKTLADLSQAKNQVATDELNMLNSNNAYELSMLELKQLMEMPGDTIISLVKPDISALISEATSYDARNVFSRALDTQPDIKQAQINTQVAEKNIEIAQGGYYPTVSISTGYGTNYSSNAKKVDPNTLDPMNPQFIRMPFGEQLDQNKSFSAGLSLNVPIFNNRRTKTAVAKAKIGRLQAQNQEDLVKRNLNKTINQAVLDLKAARQQFVSSETAFVTAKEAYEVIKERYDVGMANAMELSTAQTKMNKAEFDMIQAKYTSVFKEKVIDYYIGNPIKF